MNLKKIVLSLALAGTVLLTIPSLAEGNGGGRHHGQRDPEKMVQRMQEKLGLSGDQVTRVKAVFASHEQNFKNLREQMKQTLTEEQRQAMKESWKANKGQDRKRLSPEEREQRMAQMGISQGQIQQMKSLRQQMKAEREQIKQELSAILTPEQQQKMQEMKGKHHRKFRGEQRSE